ncbi:hypothetical protein O3S80_00830 [Streptomyces sp. Lzd4kr]|nr:hypothetical protein [Streptomyces sp. Lzd4kr]
MAIIGTLLSALGLVASSVIVVIGVSFLNSDSFEDYNDCIKHADSTSDRDQCAKDFKHDLDDN